MRIISRFKSIKTRLEKNEKLPYEDNFLMYLLKSFIEHFYYPENFNEFYRILKPGGIIISLTPDWKQFIDILRGFHT